MLKPDDLKTAIKSALTSIYKPAVEELVLGLLSDKTTAGDEMAKDIAERFDASTSDQMAELLSSAIDYYVKNTKLSRERINEIYDRKENYFFDEIEALENGSIHEIV